jgi:SAM-dependent methyltransferase
MDDLSSRAALEDSASEVFNSQYYATSCGSQPYDHSDPYWGVFFGRIADELIRSFRPKRVFDAGCAHGFLVEALWDRGVEAWGRDISSFANSDVRPDMRPYCAVGSIADPIEGRYDLITCIEVLEHMPEAEAIRAIGTMASATDRILFSSSPTDFKETTHINVRPPIYWLRLFADQGFAPDLGYDATYILPHTIVLQRAGTAPAERDLLACAELVRARVLLAEREQKNRDLAVEQTRLVEKLNARLNANHDTRNYDEAQLIVAISELEAELQATRAEAEAERDRYLLVVNSTMWLALSPIRSIVSFVPLSIRRQLRRYLGFR